MWGETTRIVEKAAVEALNALNANASQKKTGSEIYRKVCEINSNGGGLVSESVFKNYLSGLARNSESRIVKDVGAHGYYLKDETESILGATIDTPTVNDEREGDLVVERRERRETEKLLYPILQTWLQNKGYRTKDTSLMKGMGRWGNPDITGVIVDETLGAYDIELATIEAKVTQQNFRYDFFEAVSHKRFANRVFFAFAATANFLRENNEELRYYSELYGVGVIVIAIEDRHFNDYLAGHLGEIDTDQVDVYEVFSAPFESRLRRWQKSFLEQLGISNTRELWGWGSA